MELDEVGKAYVNTLLPEGADLTGMMTIVTFCMPDEEGCQWKLHRAMDMTVSESVGLMELAKMHVIATAVTGIPFDHLDDKGFC